MTIMLVKNWNPILQDTDKAVVFQNVIKHDIFTPPDTTNVEKKMDKFYLKKKKGILFPSTALTLHHSQTYGSRAVNEPDY